MKNSTQHYYTKQAKCGGFMPSVWFAISNDRTPESLGGPKG